MWRNPSSLFPGVDRSGALPPRSRTVPVGAGAPLVVAAPPAAASPSCVAADAPTVAGASFVQPSGCNARDASVTRECRVLGCGIAAGRNHRGLCVPHFDAFLTRAYDLTRSVGRGEIP